MAQYTKRPHTYSNGITSENSDESKVRTRPHARPPSKHVPSLATRSPISQRREHGTKQASGLQIPTANERCAALWAQAVWLQSPLSSTPWCCLYHDCPYTHFRNKAVCFTITIVTRADVPASAQTLDPEASMPCWAGGGVLSLL